MMPHYDRLLLVQNIRSQMLDTDEKQIVIGSVYNLTTTKSETPWSALEIRFFSQDGCEAKGTLCFMKKTFRRLMTIMYGRNPSENSALQLC